MITKDLASYYLKTGDKTSLIGYTELSASAARLLVSSNRKIWLKDVQVLVCDNVAEAWRYDTTSYLNLSNLSQLGDSLSELELAKYIATRTHYRLLRLASLSRAAASIFATTGSIRFTSLETERPGDGIKLDITKIPFERAYFLHAEFCNTLRRTSLTREGVSYSPPTPCYVCGGLNDSQLQCELCDSIICNIDGACKCNTNELTTSEADFPTPNSQSGIPTLFATPPTNHPSSKSVTESLRNSLSKYKVSSEADFPTPNSQSGIPALFVTILRELFSGTSTFCSREEFQYIMDCLREFYRRNPRSFNSTHLSYLKTLNYASQYTKEGDFFKHGGLYTRGSGKDYRVYSIEPETHCITKGMGICTNTNGTEYFDPDATLLLWDHYSRVKQIHDKILEQFRSTFPSVNEFVTDVYKQIADVRRQFEDKHKYFLLNSAEVTISNLPLLRDPIKPWRQTHCYHCQNDLDGRSFLECSKCEWIVCSCGACGCGYDRYYRLKQH